MVKPLIAIDLFSGAGGFTLAAIKAGIQVISAVEIDGAAAKTYYENFISANSYFKQNITLKAGQLDGDLSKLDPSLYRKSLGIAKAELDILLGGPPCQGFSAHRLKDAGILDPRNKLLLKYFDFVCEFQPKYFLLENVSGLFWGKHRSYLDTFLSLIKHHNYKIKFCGILNTRDYGIPQNRKRVFILGYRHDMDLTQLSFPPVPTHFSSKSNLKPQWKPASSVFEPLPKSLYLKFWNDYFKHKEGLSRQATIELLSGLEFGQRIKKKDPENIYMQPSLSMQERFKDTPLNGSREDAGKQHQLACHKNGHTGHKDVYGRMFIHKPSNTITTGCNNPSKGRFIHPWKDHGITLRHAARLQSFPDWFCFSGTTVERARQIGNAVPPELARILLVQLQHGIKQY